MIIDMEDRATRIFKNLSKYGGVALDCNLAASWVAFTSLSA